MNKQTLDDAITNAVADCNLTLHGIVQKGDRVHIYIKNPEGVSISDCENVLKQLSYSIDTDDLHIEVESSGTAPLLTQSHYEERLGQIIKVRTKQKGIRGTLQAVNDTGIVIEHGVEQTELSWNQITSATPKQNGVQ